jgi:phospholipase/carboxylesterase
MITSKNLTEAKKIVILLHGRGGSAEDIMSFSRHLTNKPCYIAITANNNQWYPYPFTNKKSLNEPYLTESLKKVQNLVDLAREHVTDENIYLLGFSQGACLALEFVSSNQIKLGGVFALSGGLIGEDSELQSKVLKDTKILIGCSENDPFIPLKRVKDTERILKERNANVTLITYPGSSHNVTTNEINFVNKELN